MYWIAGRCLFVRERQVDTLGSDEPKSPELIGLRSVASRIARRSCSLLLIAGPALSQSSAGDYSAATTEAGTLIAEGMRTSQIPGLSVAVVANGTLVWSEAFGQATIDPQVAATPTRCSVSGSSRRQLPRPR